MNYFRSMWGEKAPQYNDDEDIDVMLNEDDHVPENLNAKRQLENPNDEDAPAPKKIIRGNEPPNLNQKSTNESDRLGMFKKPPPPFVTHPQAYIQNLQKDLDAKADYESNNISSNDVIQETYNKYLKYFQQLAKYNQEEINNGKKQLTMIPATMLQPLEKLLGENLYNDLITDPTTNFQSVDTGLGDYYLYNYIDTLPANYVSYEPVINANTTITENKQSDEFDYDDDDIAADMLKDTNTIQQPQLISNVNEPPKPNANVAQVSAPPSGIQPNQNLNQPNNQSITQPAANVVPAQGGVGGNTIIINNNVPASNPLPPPNPLSTYVEQPKGQYIRPTQTQIEEWRNRPNVPNKLDAYNDHVEKPNYDLNNLEQQVADENKDEEKMDVEKKPDEAEFDRRQNGIKVVDKMVEKIYEEYHSQFENRWTGWEINFHNALRTDMTKTLKENNQQYDKDYNSAHNELKYQWEYVRKFLNSFIASHHDLKKTKLLKDNPIQLDLPVPALFGPDAGKSEKVENYLHNLASKFVRADETKEDMTKIEEEYMKITGETMDQSMNAYEAKRVLEHAKQNANNSEVKRFLKLMDDLNTATKGNAFKSMSYSDTVDLFRKQFGHKGALKNTSDRIISNVFNDTADSMNQMRTKLLNEASKYGLIVDIERDIKDPKYHLNRSDNFQSLQMKYEYLEKYGEVSHLKEMQQKREEAFQAAQQNLKKFQAVTGRPFESNLPSPNTLTTSKLEQLTKDVQSDLSIHEADYKRFEQMQKEFVNRFDDIQSKVNRIDINLLPNTNDKEKETLLFIQSKSGKATINSLKEQMSGQDITEWIDELQDYNQRLDDLDKALKHIGSKEAQRDYKIADSEYKNLADSIKGLDRTAAFSYKPNANRDEIELQLKTGRTLHQELKKKADQVRQEVLDAERDAVTTHTLINNIVKPDEEDINSLHGYANAIRQEISKKSHLIKGDFVQQTNNIYNEIEKITGQKNPNRVSEESLKGLSQEKMEKIFDEAKKEYTKVVTERDKLYAELGAKVNQINLNTLRLKEPSMKATLQPKDIFNARDSLSQLRSLSLTADQQLQSTNKEILDEEKEFKEQKKEAYQKMLFTFKENQTRFIEGAKERERIRNDNREKLQQTFNAQQKESDRKFRAEMLNKTQEQQNTIERARQWHQNYLEEWRQRELREQKLQDRALRRELQKADADLRKELQTSQLQATKEIKKAGTDQAILIQHNLQTHQKDLANHNQELKLGLIQNQQEYQEKKLKLVQGYSKENLSAQHKNKLDEMKEASIYRKEEMKTNQDYNERKLKIQQKIQKEIQADNHKHAKSMQATQEAIARRARYDTQRWNLSVAMKEKTEKKEDEQKIMNVQQQAIDEISTRLHNDGVYPKLDFLVQDKHQGNALLRRWINEERDINPTKESRQRLKNLIQHLKSEHPDSYSASHLPSHESIDQMNLIESSEHLRRLENEKLGYNERKKLEDNKNIWQRDLELIGRKISQYTGKPFNEKITSENYREYQKNKEMLEDAADEAKNILHQLNQKKQRLYNDLLDERKELTPEVRKVLPALNKFHIYHSIKGKLLDSNIENVAKDVQELEQITEHQKYIVEMNEKGRAAATDLDTYVDALKTITTDTSVFYKVLKDAAKGKESEVKLPEEFDNFQKAAKEAFELTAKHKYLPHGRKNRYLVDTIIDDAKKLFEKTEADKRIAPAWNEAAEGVLHEDPTRAKATVETLAKDPALSEMYLLSLAYDVSKNKNAINYENPIKLYTALKSIGVKTSIGTLSGSNPPEQVQKLLDQVPPHLFEKAVVNKFATDYDENEASWRRQLAMSADSATESFIRNHVISGTSHSSAVNNIMSAPGYFPGAPISRLDFGTGNFYPTTLKNVKGNEAYFVNKPKDIRSAYHLKKEKILHDANKQMGPFGVEYARDKMRRAGYPAARSGNYVNLARFLNALPGSKKFLNNKEKLLASLTGKDKARPKQKEVNAEVVKKRKGRRQKKKLQGKKVNKKIIHKGGFIETPEEDDDLVYAD